jgi:2-methylcitrate dehydratase PrpD
MVMGHIQRKMKKEGNMDLIEPLAENIVNINYNDLPEDIIDITKMCILDSIGTMIAGSDAPGCRNIVEIVKEWGGKEESTIMIYGGKVPAHDAALANAVMARALDFDDGVDKGMHMSSSLIPTAFAAGEKIGGINGKEFLTAIALGTDIAVRISKATLDYHGFDPTLTCGIFGTTACAAKILGFNKEKMKNALGIAFNESSGSFQSNIDGALSVRLNQGFAACEGIMSAIFADRGITGVKNVLNGIYGYFHLISNDKSNLIYVKEDLGKKFYGTETLFKRWPSCGGTLTAADATLELKEEYNIDPDEVDNVIVRVGEYCYNICGGHEFRIGENPVVDAQFSHQYVVANILLRGKPNLKHFTDEYIKDPNILKLIKKIKPVVDSERDSQEKLLETDIEITLKDGRVLTKRIDVMRGHPQKPLTMDDIIDKFKDNILFARDKGVNLKNNSEDRIINIISDIENVKDIREIIPLLIF